jgi:mono/diheme cytochrome c family protein
MKRAGVLLVSLVFGVAAWAGGRSLLQRAEQRGSERNNPFAGGDQDQLAGAKLYTRECAPCHGANRDGVGKTPPLKQAEVYSAPAGTLFWALTNGALRRGMPSFAHLPEAQRWQIITFLQTPSAK